MKCFIDILSTHSYMKLEHFDREMPGTHFPKSL